MNRHMFLLWVAEERLKALKIQLGALAEDAQPGEEVEQYETFLVEVADLYELNEPTDVGPIYNRWMAMPGRDPKEFARLLEQERNRQRATMIASN